MIITTVSLVLKQILAQFKTIDSSLRIVYDPNLDYQDSIQKERSDVSYDTNNASDATNHKALPLLAYNRSVLRSSLLGGRGPRHVIREVTTADTDLDKITAAYCEMDFKFSYLTDNMEETENFEINYYTQDGISQFKQITVDLSAFNLGTWTYQVMWSESLEDFVINHAGNSYKSVTGSANIKGWFVTMDGTEETIETIRAHILETPGSAVLSDITIPT